jgi:hypothetical protein
MDGKKLIGKILVMQLYWSEIAFVISVSGVYRLLG